MEVSNVCPSELLVGINMTRHLATLRQTSDSYMVYKLADSIYHTEDNYAADNPEYANNQSTVKQQRRAKPPELSSNLAHCDNLYRPNSSQQIAM